MRTLFLCAGVAVLVAFICGCGIPKERRGDWMEHLNDKQFDSEPPMSHAYRRNYHSMEELREMWQTTYEKAIAALDKVITENSE